MEIKECCKIILEHVNKLKTNASNIVNEIKVGNRKEADASSMIAVVNSWKLLPNKCDDCIAREKFVQNSIKNIQNKRGYEYKQ